MVRLCARCGGPGVGSAVESVPGALEQGYSGAAAGAEAWRNQADRFQLRQVRLIGGAQTPAGQVGQRGAEFAEIRPLVRAAREPDDHDCPHMACARLGRLRAPAMASALRRELVRLGHRPTAFILIACFVFRNMPVGVRAGIAALSQIDKSLDEASLTLGARSATTLRRVVLPLLRPAILASMVYSFVRAMTAVSAVIFLVSAQWNMATTYIVGRVEAGEFGLAIAYSSVLIVVMLVAISLIDLFAGEPRLRRRMPAQPPLPFPLSANPT